MAGYSEEYIRRRELRAVQLVAAFFGVAIAAAVTGVITWVVLLIRLF